MGLGSGRSGVRPDRRLGGGRDSLSAAVSRVGPDGIIVSFKASSNEPARFDPRTFYRKGSARMLGYFVVVRAASRPHRNGTRLAALSALVAEGRLVLSIDHSPCRSKRRWASTIGRPDATPGDRQGGPGDLRTVVFELWACLVASGTSSPSTTFRSRSPRARSSASSACLRCRQDPAMRIVLRRPRPGSGRGAMARTSRRLPDAPLVRLHAGRARAVPEDEGPRSARVPRAAPWSRPRTARRQGERTAELRGVAGARA